MVGTKSKFDRKIFKLEKKEKLIDRLRKCWTIDRHIAHESELWSDLVKWKLPRDRKAKQNKTKVMKRNKKASKEEEKKYSSKWVIERLFKCNNYI